MRLSILLTTVYVVLVLSTVAGAPAATPAHDSRTLIAKLARSVDGMALSKQLENAKRGVPIALASLRASGVESVEPLFPIPPRGLDDSSSYDSLGLGQRYILYMDGSQSAELAASELRSDPSIEAVELNYVGRHFESVVSPNDPLYGLQWHYAAMNLPAAWNITTGSGAVTVAVLDNGFQLDHPDLIWAFRVNMAENTGFIGVDDDFNGFIDDVMGWDFGNDDNNPYATFLETHGTHVAGTIGALSNNSTGVAGVDWNCLLLPVHVFSSVTGGTLASDVAAGVYYARIMGARVVNMSLGFPAYSATLDEQLNYAYLAGVFCVAASGNENSSVGFPASSAWVMAVGGTNASDDRFVYSDTEGSNHGGTLDVVAPGDNIYSTFPTWYSPYPSYGPNIGTSMASPHAAGLASLILSVRASLTPDSIYVYIAAGAQDLVGNPNEDTPGWDQYYGYGRINAYNSIRLALGQCVCKCGNDPQCDGVTNAQDVVLTVNVVFRGASSVFDFGCPKARTDFDANGVLNAQDIVRLVNVAFRGQPASAQFTDPCQ